MRKTEPIAPKPAPTFLSGAQEMLTGGILNILLLTIPFAFMSQGLGWPDSVTFIFALLAIAPLAERLGFVTEQLALHTNETIGGLLNVTFGNATELIVAVAALFKGLYRVVQLTLLGSILSNMLLVLGCAFLFGGLKHRTQSYQKITAQVNMTLLMLAVMALLLPTVLVGSITVSDRGDRSFSRFTSFILLFMYGCLLYFQVGLVHINKICHCLPTFSLTFSDQHFV
jgi:Ca2+:H+ antiporter